MAADEAMLNSIDALYQNHIPGWNKDVGEKHKVARHTYFYWMENHESNSGPLFDSMKENKKELEYSLPARRKSKEKRKADAMATLHGANLPKILAKHPKKQEIMASIYSGRGNRK